MNKEKNIEGKTVILEKSQKIPKKFIYQKINFRKVYHLTSIKIVQKYITIILKH